MVKRIRFIKCPNPDEEVKRIDKLYDSWLDSRSPYIKEMLIKVIDNIQPYVEYELLYEGINYNL